MSDIAGSDAAIAHTVRFIAEYGCAVEMCGVRIEHLGEYNLRQDELHYYQELQERTRQSQQNYIISLENRIDELERENAEMRAFGLDSDV